MRPDEPDEPESSSAIQTSITVNDDGGTSPQAGTLQYDNPRGSAELPDDRDSSAISRPPEDQDLLRDAVVNTECENENAVSPAVDELFAQSDLQPFRLDDTQRLSDNEVQSNVPQQAKDEAVSWRDLPNKKQLALLTVARLAEPLSQSSLQAYMFYQLQSFDPTLPASSISLQAGVLQASFTGAQFLTAILWGRIADSERGGRKRVLLVGIMGTCVSCVGVGFSTSFVSATLFRAFGGAMNGNLGVLRTMVSEIISEKKFQSRAFSLLPIGSNIGMIVGPILGGLLANPVENYPSLFGDNSIFGGEAGVLWMTRWPYLLPNLIMAIFLFIAGISVFLGLEETLMSLRSRPDVGISLGQAAISLFGRIIHRRSHRYVAINSNETIESSPGTANYELETRTGLQSAPASLAPRPKLPLRRLWTRNVLCTLLVHGILAFHISSFQNLWFIFLSTPRFNPTDPIPPGHHTQTLPFHFTGGLGMHPASVGFAMAILGLIGITMQIFLYPVLSHRLGTIRSFRLSLLLFPVAYCLAPYLAVVPTSVAPPAQASGALVYAVITGVLFIQVLARTFALPSIVILLNNSCPHPSILGTMHGVAQSVNNASRMLGPVLTGWGFGAGLRAGVVGSVWWALAGVAATGWLTSALVREGSGHETILEGDPDPRKNGGLRR
ncbi:hypothetical protein MMC07_001592 [Pseudocyphellaria aurata]|nr:hypothetical protein [Pseudocyphellaria aurata]